MTTWSCGLPPIVPKVYSVRSRMSRRLAHLLLIRLLVLSGVRGCPFGVLGQTLRQTDQLLFTVHCHFDSGVVQQLGGLAIDRSQVLLEPGFVSGGHFFVLSLPLGIERGALLEFPGRAGAVASAAVSPTGGGGALPMYFCSSASCSFLDIFSKRS